MPCMCFDTKYRVLFDMRYTQKCSFTLLIFGCLIKQRLILFVFFRCCCCFRPFLYLLSRSDSCSTEHPYCGSHPHTISSHLLVLLLSNVAILLHVHFSNSSSSASLSIRLSAQYFHSNQRIMCERASVCVCQGAKRKQNIVYVHIIRAKRNHLIA